MTETEKLQQAIDTTKTKASVRRAAGHLLVKDASGNTICRVTPYAEGYGLSFRNHRGVYEKMPICGSLQDIAIGIEQILGPFFHDQV